MELVRRIVVETNKPYINKTIDRFNCWHKTDIPHYEHGKGLSIGAVVSQFLAIFCLSEIDRKIKGTYKCKRYLRYMDDLIILGWDKKELKQLIAVIKEDLASVKLKINPKSAVYNLCSLTGVPFLGYRYYIDIRGGQHIVCLSRTVRRIRRRLKYLARYDPEKYPRSYEAYRGYFMNTFPVRDIEEFLLLYK